MRKTSDYGVFYCRDALSFIASCLFKFLRMQRCQNYKVNANHSKREASQDHNDQVCRLVGKL